MARFEHHWAHSEEGPKSKRNGTRGLRGESRWARLRGKPGLNCNKVLYALPTYLRDLIRYLIHVGFTCERHMAAAFAAPFDDSVTTFVLICRWDSADYPAGRKNDQANDRQRSLAAINGVAMSPVGISLSIIMDLIVDQSSISIFISIYNLIHIVLNIRFGYLLIRSKVLIKAKMMFGNSNAWKNIENI